MDGSVDNRLRALAVKRLSRWREINHGVAWSGRAVNRWINPDKGRYYQVDLVQDLFGDWTLTQVWGGLGSRRGQVRIVYVPSYAAGVERIEHIAKRRQQRGYRDWRFSTRHMGSGDETQGLP
jgi:predicted DNA-binding WGR domain protein